MVIEPLAEAVRCNPHISGIFVNGKQHKIALYADDILLFVTQPEESISVIMEIIEQFSKISGYKINFSKSETMPLGRQRSRNPPTSFPFKWALPIYLLPHCYRKCIELILTLFWDGCIWIYAFLSKATYSTFRLYIFLSVYVFPENWNHNLCAGNTMLYHWATGTLIWIDGLLCQCLC